MNNQLNKYFFSNIMGIWLIILSCLMAVIWLNQSLRILDVVITQGASFADFLRFSFLAAPLWLIVTVPLSAFIAILWTLHRFLSDREIVVMQAVGLSPLQLSVAPVLFSILLSAFLFFNSLILLPLGFSGFKTVQDEVRNTIPKLLLQDNVFIDIDQNLTIFIGEKHSRNSVGNVFIQDTQNKKKHVTYTAEIGEFTTLENQPVVILKNGQRTETSVEAEKSTIISFDSYTLNIIRDTQKQSPSERVKDANEESVSNLFNRNLAANDLFWRQRFAEAHYRLSSPLLVISLSITAIALFFYRLSKQVSLAKRLTLASLFGLAIQILYVMSKSLVINYPFLWPAMYLVPIIPAIIGFVSIISSSQKDRLLSFQLAELHE
ncbi:MAG: LptF/LptG family permease [SAR116 cluster bacterium]|jgi:lipopolysaccharide export system permease protein|nr:MAG: LptF/LptG family permease [SAR116 cluster bacterium]